MRTTVLHDIDLRSPTARSSGWSGRTRRASRRSASSPPAWRPASIGGALTGTVSRSTASSTAGLAAHQLAERVGVGFQNPATQRSGIAGTVFEEVALGPMNLGLPVAETVARAHEAIARAAASRRSPARPAPALRRPGAARRHRRRSSRCGRAPRDPRRADRPARPGGDAPGRRGASRARAATGTSLLIAEHKTDLLDGLCARIVAIDGGRHRPRRPDGGSSSTTRGSSRWGVEPPSRVAAGRALAAGGLDPAVVVGRRVTVGGAHDRRAAILRTEGLVHVYPDGTRALDGVDLASAAASGSRSSARTARGKSTLVRHFNGLLRPTEGRVLVDGGTSADARVAQLAATGRARVPGPGPADLRREGPGRGRVRAAEPGPARRRTWRAAARSALAAVGLSSATPTRTRTTSATRGASCWRSRRSSRCARRSSSSTSRRPARTPAASSASGAIVADLARGRPDGRRDQPRHALRRRGVRARRRDARRADRPRRHRRRRCSPRRPWPTLASTFLEPPLAARRCAPRARLHADRGSPDRGAIAGRGASRRAAYQQPGDDRAARNDVSRIVDAGDRTRARSPSGRAWPSETSRSARGYERERRCRGDGTARMCGTRAGHAPDDARAGPSRRPDDRLHGHAGRRRRYG